MGYAGYVPAKLPPAKATPEQAAVASVKSFDSLEIIGKLIYNCAVSPKEDKYRKIRITNPKIKQLIVDVSGGMDVLTTLGWVVSEEDPEFLVIPPGRYMTMKEVRMIEEAKDKLKKDVREAARS